MTSTDEDQWDSTYLNILEDIISEGATVDSRTGEVKETIGYEFTIGQPRTRCLQNSTYEFNPFRALGHWLWIMAGRMDLSFIEFYNRHAENFSSDNVRLHGAYGPRLSGTGVYNQINNIIKLINNNGNTRRALAPIFIPAFDQFPMRHDSEHYDEIPCPLALHLLPRDGILHCITYMRSQNAYKLLPLDVFTLTLTHEYVAAATALELGTYRHYSGSLHLPTDKIEETIKVIDNPESSILMPEIPETEPNIWLKKLLCFEEQVRGQATHTQEINGDIEWDGFLTETEDHPEFWALVRNMVIFWAMYKSKSHSTESMKELCSDFHPSIKPFGENFLDSLESKRS